MAGCEGVLESREAGAEGAGRLNGKGIQESGADPDGPQDGRSRALAPPEGGVGPTEIEVDFGALPRRKRRAIELEGPVGLPGEEARRAGQDPGPRVAGKRVGRLERARGDRRELSSGIGEAPRLLEKKPKAVGCGAQASFGAVAGELRPKEKERPETEKDSDQPLH
jgi:hypothetical protein